MTAMVGNPEIFGNPNKIWFNTNLLKIKINISCFLN
jgi:hypothetical protein